MARIRFGLPWEVVETIEVDCRKDRQTAQRIANHDQTLFR